MTIEAISPDLFGKDHWSLLAYVSDRCTKGLQGVGMISQSSMRCNESRHPDLASKPLMAPWRQEQSTRTTEKVINGHDDWDCLYDLQGADLIALVNIHCLSVRMTPAGLQLSSRLR